ncbi:MAG: glycoside hydrolase family 3 C-terminal domain-containing protein, partial [Chloroflexota bacterium]|nr:glycoside hydrolase family 3 C-terminal domain-containing protein [Chloroflexota bacterium]
VGQLMSIAFHGTKITPAVEAMIRQRAVGGIVLRAENADDAAGLAKLIADIQSIAKDAKVPPLLMSIDQEGGPVIRIGRGMTIVPGQMALAATPDPLSAIKVANTITAVELAANGVRWNFAPVADVNDEPRNPIIANRSFGSDPQRVAQLVAQSVSAYRASGMLTTAKHFPGHGSTTTDSHTGLPEIDSDRKRLDSVELVPFKAAIAAGVDAIMSAHIVVPALDPTPSLPVTLSKTVMTDLLRKELGFQGLIVSDDLEMGALATIGEAQAGLRAFEAGVDHLLFRFDESAYLEGHRLLVEAARSGRIAAARLDASVQRFIGAKVQQGLYENRAPPAPELTQNERAAMDLARQSITLLSNEGVLPLRGRVLAVGVIGADIGFVAGDGDLGTELAAARPNTTARRFAQATDAFIASAVADARSADVVVVGVADVATNDDQRRLVEALRAVKPTVLVSLRGPYDSLYVSGVAAIVCAYGGRVPTLRALAEMLTGARRPVGRLPVVIPGRYAIGAGRTDF